MSSTQNMIEVDGLRKFYGPFEALKGISFSVGKGEIVGFLGPNGAGKTTTMKILTGYISATAGSCRVAGYDSFSESLKVRQNIGYLPENAPLYPDMGIVEYLRFVCDIRRIPRSERKSRIGEIVSRVGLMPMIKKNIGELSKGYRQRVGLAQALIHKPPVLILDEPTSGLDPNQIVEIRQLIKELGEERTIILSTHNLPEVRMTCSRMIIIANGKKVADGTAEQLESEGITEPRFIVSARLPDGTDAAAGRATLMGVSGVKAVEVRTTDDVVEYSVVAQDSRDLREAVYAATSGAGWTLRELRQDVMDLEKIFHNLTQY